MLTQVNPKLPMRKKSITQDYYVNRLGFQVLGNNEFEDYLMVQKDEIELHFFLFENLNPKENYGQVYIRLTNIDRFYQSLLDNEVSIHPNGKLQNKPWGQREFSLLDPDHNLLTFGESVVV